MEQKEIDELLENAQEAEKASTPTGEEKSERQGKIFQKYKIKDIVFLAIITACTLVTGAIMPLLVNVPLFGIIQLGLGIQFSLFPVIGMMKVKKPGASVSVDLYLDFPRVHVSAYGDAYPLCGHCRSGCAPDISWL